MDKDLNGAISTEEARGAHLFGSAGHEVPPFHHRPLLAPMEEGTWYVYGPEEFNNISNHPISWHT